MHTLILAVFLMQQGPVPVGMILQNDGSVFVQRGSSRIPAKLADLLYSGDQVITTTGQASFLFCPSNERVSMKNGTTLELTASAIAMRAGNAPLKTAAKCALPKVALGTENLEHVGGLRARGNPPISIFLGGPITTTRPFFEWSPSSNAGSYQLIVRDSDGSTVWQQRVPASASSISFPQGMSLKEGKYQWELRAETDGKLIAQQTAAFEVKPNAELSRSIGTDPAVSLTHAVELENAGYFAEAAEAYRTIQKTNADDVRIARRLVSLYWNAGLVAAANELIEKNHIK